MPNRDRRSLKLFVVGAWMIFSVSLATWWVIFSLTQVEMSRHQKMLVWEGGFLILLLICGGLALTYFVYQENKRYRQVSEFFATFSHELKTSIASLRLQAESLQEDFLADGAKVFEEQHKKLLHRLMKDSVRLELQLENSLFLANVENQQLFVEQLPLSRLIEGIRPQWPSLDLILAKDCLIKGDRRAIESVLKNLIQNSVIHGQAKQVSLSPKLKNGIVHLSLHDDGIGFSGNSGQLGRLFKRHNPTSGSGVGLYLAKQLMRKMDGDIQFRPSNNGFSTDLKFIGGGL